VRRQSHLLQDWAGILVAASGCNHDVNSGRLRLTQDTAIAGADRGARSREKRAIDIDSNHANTRRHIFSVERIIRRCRLVGLNHRAPLQSGFLDGRAAPSGMLLRSVMEKSVSAEVTIL
jgi:hypothetical protein